jgi:hypothetical protein
MSNWLAYIHDFLTADPLLTMVLGSFIGAVLSVPVTWVSSWWYYQRQAEDLRHAAHEVQREAQHLRHYLRDLVLLEEKGRRMKLESIPLSRVWCWP